MAEPKRIRLSSETASESAPRGGDTGLIQQLLAKEEECRQKDKALKEKDEVIRAVSYTHLTLPTIYSV